MAFPFEIRLMSSLVGGGGGGAADGVGVSVVGGVGGAAAAGNSKTDALFL